MTARPAFDLADVFRRHGETYQRANAGHLGRIERRVIGAITACAIRWVWRFRATGEISPAPTGGDRRSNRIEAHRDYLLGLIGRQPDVTLLEIQERLIANCGERFSSSVIWRFFDRHEITLKKRPRMPRSSSARTS